MSDVGGDEGGVEDPPSAARVGRIWGVFFRLLIVFVIAGTAVTIALVWLAGRSINATKETVVEIVEAFRPEEVVESFEEWKDFQAEGNEGNILEVATAEATEKFERTSHLEMFGKVLPLGMTASEITVPATYRYHIDLAEEWLVTSDGERLLVLAPAIRPTLPVAFDTGKMEKKTKSGWARWDGDENLEALEKTISSKLSERAGSDEAIDEVREASRVSVAKFVQSWLLNRDAWAEDRFEEIVVIFEGEDEENLSELPASIRVGEPLEPVPAP